MDTTTPPMETNNETLNPTDNSTEGSSDSKTPEAAAPKSLITPETETSENSGGSQVTGSQVTGSQVTDSQAADSQAADGEQTSQEATENSVPKTADGYKVSWPEGLKEEQIDKDLLVDYQTQAHELGLSQKQFEGLAKFYAEKTGSTLDKFNSAQRQAIISTGETWAKELTARPGFNADKGFAQKALAEFGTPELYKYFDESMAGNYPPMFDFMAKVGKALAEPGIKEGGKVPPKQTDGAMFYPAMK